MIVAFIIGVILTLLVIWILKGTRTVPSCSWGKPAKGEEPILKVWSVLLLLLAAVIPLINIIVAVVMLIVWAIQIWCEDDWKYIRPKGKIAKFLNKPIQ